MISGLEEKLGAKPPPPSHPARTLTSFVLIVTIIVCEDPAAALEITRDHPRLREAAGVKIPLPLESDETNAFLKELLLHYYMII